MDEFISVFLREEMTPYVRKMICDKISKRTAIIVETINLNKYDIIIDFDNNTVLIDEITFIEFAESRTMSISEFSAIINC